MIKVNGNKYTEGTFPDNSKLLKLIDYSYSETVVLDWRYEDDSELVTIIFLTKHLQEHNYRVALNMPYIPNARMDRVKRREEVFTLKYFCSIVNSLNFEYVRVLDAHSNVSLALLDRVVQDDVDKYISVAIDDIYDGDDFVLYFPDSGAMKRYESFSKRYKFCYGEKNRDWTTGKITGLEINTNGLDLTDKTILMVDDIICYGGSMYYSALELKKMKVGKIFAYATHVENSIADPEKGTLINSGLLENIYTTNSLFNQTHKSIKVITI